MRLTIVSGSLPPIRCGVGAYTYRLIDSLAKNADVSLVTTTGVTPHPLAKDVFYIRNWKAYQLLLIVRKIMKTKPDIVHIQYPAVAYKRHVGINLLPLALKFFMPSTPVVVTLHEYFGSGYLGRLRNRITVRRAAKIFVSNPYDFKSLPERLRNKAQVIPIGSNIPIAERNPSKYQAIIKEAGFETKPVVFFGFPYENKGLEKLIDAAHEGRFPVLFLCGFDNSDSYQSRLLKKINYAKSQGTHLHVTGFLDDETVSQVLQELDVFVLPQIIPLTAKSGSAIAAVTHGLVIISGAAEYPDLNLPYVNDVNSILLRNMTVQNITAAAMTLLNNKPRFSALKTESLKLNEHFSWANIAEMHDNEYRKLKK